MLNIVANMDECKRMELFVDTCGLQTPEEVSRLFLEYTLLIWDYLMVGKIYDYYTDDIVLNHANGVCVCGIEKVIGDTLAAVAATPADNQTIFVDIFAEGNPEDGYHFIQSTTAYRPSENGDAPYASPEGRVLDNQQNGRTGLCECQVKKVDGRWKIVEEWLVRAAGNTPGKEGNR